MKLPYEGHEFEALKMRYEDQVVLLRTLTDIDLRIFIAFFTLQLALGGWIASNPVSGLIIKWGLLLIDLALSIIAGALLRNNALRRQEVKATIDNLNRILGFEDEGVYSPRLKVNAQTEMRLWLNWYLLGIVVATGGIILIIFFPMNRGKLDQTGKPPKIVQSSQSSPLKARSRMAGSSASSSAVVSA